MRDNEI